jgi:hypothetical protein
MDEWLYSVGSMVLYKGNVSENQWFPHAIVPDFLVPADLADYADLLFAKSTGSAGN